MKTRPAAIHSAQLRVAAFVARHRLEADPAHRLLDVVSELGELAKEALEASRYGRRKFKPTPAWRDEFGDVAFALLCLANSTGVDFEAAVQAALKKYARRLRRRGAAGSRALS